MRAAALISGEPALCGRGWVKTKEKCTMIDGSISMVIKRKRPCSLLLQWTALTLKGRQRCFFDRILVLSSLFFYLNLFFLKKKFLSNKKSQGLLNNSGLPGLKLISTIFILLLHFQYDAISTASA